MKLKTYIIPDFRTIEVRSGAYCGPEISVVNNETGGGSTGNTGNTGDGEEENDAGASIFRDGIWDEE